jgi:hypothetical protein
MTSAADVAAVAAEAVRRKPAFVVTRRSVNARKRFISNTPMREGVKVAVCESAFM